MNLKTCKDCGESKPLEEYPNEKRNNDGKGPRCKPCDSKFLKIARDKRPKKEIVYEEPPKNVRCNECTVTKPNSEFYIRKKSGRVDQPCKSCVLSRLKERREINRENYKNDESIKKKECSTCHIIYPINMYKMRLINLSGYDNKCIQCRNKTSRNEYKKRSNEWKARQKENQRRYREINRQINSNGLRIIEKLCSKCNIVKKVEEFPIRLGNKDGLHYHCRMCWRENARNKHTRRKLSSSEYKIACRLKNAIRNALVRENTGKKAHTEELLGASIQTVRKNLEYHFEPGMTWENHGWGENKWNLDHQHPISAFYLEDLQEQKKML